MAIQRRLSESIWVALLCDPVIEITDADARAEYARTRDLEKFAEAVGLNTESGVLMPINEPVTMIQVSPITFDDVNMMSDQGAISKRYIIQSHVTAVKNFDGVAFEKRNGRSVMTDDGYKVFNEDTSVSGEIYKVMEEMGRGANGVDRPFSLPDGWQRVRLQLLQLPAVTAMSDRLARAISSSPTQSEKKDASYQSSSSTSTETSTT